MRLPPHLCLLLTMLPLVAAGYSSAHAQAGYYQQRSPNESTPGYYQRQPPPGQRAYPPGYYPGKLVQPAPSRGFSLRRLFGIPDDPPPPPPMMRRRTPVEARPPRPRPAAPPSAVARQEKPKPAASTQVVVFGDSFADFAGQGIEDIYSESQDVGVVLKTKADAGLIRTDLADWPKVIKETLDGGQKISLAVVMLGAGDRQPIRDGTETYEPLSDKWQDVYAQRVDAVMQVFRERSIPVVWIGVPPIKSDKLSEDLIGMNEIIREAVQRLGGAYVDIWPGFVDDDNHYTIVGPDVEGQPAKLRANDGVFFTKAGARKIAHFADVEIKRILETKQAALPGSGGDSANGELPSIEASLPAPPEPAGAPVLPVKPAIGPVLPLTRPDVSPGGTLMSKPPALDGDQAYLARRALRDGAAPNPQPGRADDFHWP